MKIYETGSDTKELILEDSVVVLLGEVVSAAAKDPRNISYEEWKIIDPIYNALSEEQWQDVKAVAISRSDHVRRTSGPGENSNSAKRQQKEIHQLLASK